MNSKKRSTGHSFTNTRIGKKAPRSPIAAAVASLFKRRAMFERLEDRTMLSVAGDIDQTFGVAGLRTTNFAGNGNDEAYSVALQSGGNYVVAGGTSGQTAFGLSRYSSAGTLLSSTEASGIGAPGQAQAVAVLPDGGIIAAGYSFALPSNFNFTLVKYTAAGAVDTSWGTSGIVVTPISNRADEAFAIAVQPTGPSSYKVIVAGGNFTSATREAFALARYNSDGSLDSSFGTGGIVTTSVGATGSGEIHALAINGSTLYAGGQAQNAGGNYDFALARYSLANGSLSSLTLTDFSSGSDDRANAMGIDSSGNVYLGGVTGGAAGNFAAAKYNSAGVLDASFGSGGIVTTAFSSGLDAANGLAVQYNGKVLLSGYTTTASGESDLALVRLNSDGSLDSNFGTGGKVTTPVAPVGSHAQGNAVLVDNTKAVVVGSIDNGTNTASPDDFLLARYQLNNAPTLGNSTASLTDITQGQTNNPGTQISVLANAAHLNGADVDGDTVALAVTGFTDAGGNGTWQYSIDSGANWTNIPAVDAHNALLLASADRVRFVPAGSFVSTPGSEPTLSVVAWDQTSGTHGTFDDTVPAPANDPQLAQYGSTTRTLSQTVLAAANTVYVNTSWTGSNQDDMVTDSFGTHRFGIDAFATISDGVQFVSGGGSGVVHVDAGTYVEPVVVDKPIELLGPNDSVNPNTGSRSAEAIVEPDDEAPNPFGGGHTLIYVAVDNVTVKGFTIEGDNPSLTGGVNVGGANVDLAEGISSYEGVNHADVQNNIVKDISYTALHFENFNNSEGVTSGNTLSNNKIQNVGYSGYASAGDGILMSRNFYATVANNVMSGVEVGVDLERFFTTDPGSSHTISGNTISSTQAGVLANLLLGSPSTFAVSGNSFTAADAPGGPRWDGAKLLSVSGSASITFSNDTVSGGLATQPTAGYEAWNTSTSGVIDIAGGSVTGTTYGVFANNFDGFNQAATGSTAITVDGLSISNATTAGVYVKDSASDTGHHSVNVTLINAATISGGPNSVVVEGAAAHVTFSGSPGNPSAKLINPSGDYIHLQGNAAPTYAGNIDARTAAFGATVGTAVQGDSLSQSQAFDVEDKITDALDNGSLGFVRIRTGQVDVTNQSSAGAIQRGINTASIGDNVNIKAGSYSENANVSKSVQLLGPNAGVNPNTGSRGAEAQVNPTSGGTPTLAVTADNVTIDGLQFSGGGTGISGATTGAAVHGLTVQNNVLQSQTLYGINIDTTTGTSSVSIAGNKITSAGGASTDGIRAWQTGGTISANFISSAFTGIGTNFHVNNSALAGTLTITGNHISGAGFGMGLSGLGDGSVIGGSNASDANVITASGPSPSIAGIGIVVQWAAGQVTVRGNNVTVTGPADAGVVLFHDELPAKPVLITGNTISGPATGTPAAAGIYATNNGAAFGDENGDTYATLTGNTVSRVGVGVYLDGSGSTHVTQVSVGDGTAGGSNTITGVAGGTGILSAGPHVTASVSGNNTTIQNNTIGIDIEGGSLVVDNNAFSGNGTDLKLGPAGTLTSLTGNTFTGTQFINDQSSTGINATANSFNVGAGNAQVAAGSLTLAQAYAVEDRIIDGIDQAGLGLVRLQGGKVFVSQASETPNLGAIQRAVNIATSGDEIDVQAGTFKENVTVSKSLQLLGANAGTAGSASRGAETTIVTNGNQSAVITVTSSNVTIDGVTVSGDDTSVAGTAVYSGADANALYGITNGNTSTGALINNLIVRNDIVQRTAIGFLGNLASGVALGNSITNNLLQDIGVFDFGYAISLRNNFYANVTNNVMRRVYTGVHVNNFSAADPGGFSITGNDIQAYANGLWANQAYSSAPTMLVDNNSFTTSTTNYQLNSLAPVTNNIGVLVTGGPGYVGTAFTNNTIANQDYGVVVWDTPSGVTLGNTNSIAGGKVGVYVTNNVGFNPIGTTNFGLVTGTTNAATLDGISISTTGANSVGLWVRGDSGGASSTATLQNGVSISGGVTGLKLDGSAAQLSGNSLGNTALSGQSSNYVALANAAAAGITLNGTGASYSGTVGNSLSQAAAWATEDKILDALDDGSVGFVRIRSGQVDQTPTSGDGAIQRAVDAAASGDNINVQAGTYHENVNVNKSVQLLGPNAAIDPNTGVRVGEAIVEPAVTETSLQSSTSGVIFRVGTNAGHVDVTIKGFTIDGHNASLTGGRTLNGVMIDTGAGIANSIGSFDTNPGAYDATMIVQNNVIQNLERYGVLVDNTASRSPKTGNDVSFNKIDNLPSGNTFGGDRGRGVAFEENTYGSVTYNTITRVNVGWQDDNNNLASPGASTLIDHNTISTYHRGIFHNLQYQDASAITISNNNISAEASGASATNFGIELASIQSNVNEFVTNNNVTGNVYGILLWNLPTTANIVVSGGTLTNNAYGVFATSNDPQFAAGAASHSTISGVSIVNPTIAGIAIDDSANIASTMLSITGGTSVSGGPTGLLISGPGASVGGNTLNDTSFSGQTSNYIQLTGGAEAGMTINGTGASYGGAVGNSQSQPAAWATEDKIVDALDDGTVGFVRIRSGNVDITPNSFVAPATDATGAVQRAVNVAVPGDVVNIENGVYPGQVVIATNITLLGESQSGAIIRAVGSLPATFTTSAVNHPVVFVHDSTATIQQLTVDGNGQGGGSNNRISGIGMHNAGGMIDHVTVEHVRQTPLNGVQEGVGILVSNSDAAARALTVSNNTIFNYQKNGMALAGAGLTVTVTGNTVTGAGSTTAIGQNGIQISGGATGSISGNTVSGNEYSGAGSGADFLNDVQSVGVLIFASDNVSVTNNTVDGNDIGIYNFGSGGTISGNTLGSVSANRYEGVFEDEGSSSISGNHITGGNVGVAVVAFDGDTGTSQATVSGNTISGTGVGIEGVVQSSGDPAALVTASGNTVSGSGVGIEFSGGKGMAQNNVLSGNTTGVLVSSGALVDLGDAGNTDLTGLGSSAGHNTLTGYTGTGNNFAIDDQNTVAGSQPDVKAQKNNFGPYTNINIVGTVIRDHADNAALTTVDYSQALNQQPAPNTVYVNSAWAGSSLGSDPDGAGPGTAFGVDEFATIQDGADAVAVNGLVEVEAGTYKENVTITHAATIDGAGQASTTVYSAVSNPLGSGSGSLNGGANIFLVQANNVTIQNLTIDGDNPSLTSGVVAGGADIDARNGIITNHNAGVFNGLNVNHVTVQNIYLRGIYASSGGSFDFQHDTIDNVQADPASIGMFNFAGSGVMAFNTVSNTNDAISANHSTGTIFHDNTITSSGSGIHTDNNGDGAGSVGDQIYNNHVSAGMAGGSYGIFVFVPYVNVSVHDNVISGVDVGLGAYGGQGGVSTFTNNTVSVNNLGLGAQVSTDTFGFGQMNVVANFSGGSFTGGTGGIAVQQGAGATATASISGVTINDPTIGIDVDGGSATITGNHIFNNNIGIRMLDGGTAGITGNDFTGATPNVTDLFVDSTAGLVSGGSLAGNQFAGSKYYVDLNTTQNLDATGATFDQASNFRIEDRMHHRIDTDLAVTNGLVTWVAGNEFVTAPASHSAGSTDTDSTIQRGIDAAAVDDTVNIEAGTFSQNVNVNKRITLSGAGSGASASSNTIIQPGAANTPILSLSVGGASAASRLLVENLRVTGATGGGNSGTGISITGGNGFTTLDNIAAVSNSGNGVAINSTNAFTDIVVQNSLMDSNSLDGIRIASSIASLNGFTIDNTTISNNFGSGFETNPSGTTNESVTNITISNSTFSNNNTGNGSTVASISLFAFHGNVSFVNDTVAHSHASHAIQIDGRNQSGPVGTMSFSGVTLTGTPGKAGIVVQNFATQDLSTKLSFNNVDLSGVASTGGWAALDIEAGAGQVNLGNTKFKALGAGQPVAIAMAGAGGADATGAVFVDGSNNAVTNPFRIADSIVDAVDVSGLGLVRIVAGNVYVTQNSFLAPATATASIQRGVDAASTGEIVNVEAGSYTGGTTINKQLTLRGAGAGVDARTRSITETIVSNAGGAFGIHANGVVIDGFTLTGQSNTNAGPGFGFAVFMAPGVDGTQVLNNIIRNNNAGIGLSNAGTTTATIDQNLFKDNTTGGLATGIYADQFSAGAGGVKNVIISNNDFTNSSFVENAWAIGISNTGTTAFTGITVTDDTISNSGRGMYFYNSSNVTVHNSTVSGATHYAIGVFGDHYYAGEPGNSNVTITDNTLDNNGKGVLVQGDGATAPAVTGGTLDIANNFIDNNDIGVDVTSDALGGGSVAVNENHIAGNSTAGVENDSSTGIDATQNWWGSADGPNSSLNSFHPNNPAGDKVIGNATFIPWLTSGVDQQPATKGFQPTAADTQPPVITSPGTTASGTEGAQVTLNGTWTDADDPTLNQTYTTVWHLVSTTTGQVIADQSSATLQFTPDEEGTYVFSFTVTDHAGNSDSRTTTITVADAALHAHATTVNATEGAAVTNVLVATFTDDDPAGTVSDYTAVINWGDGDTTASYSIVADINVAGQFDVMATKSHTYSEEGSKPVTVTISDAGGASDVAHSTASIADAALSLVKIDFVAIEGAGLTDQPVATLTDAADANSDAGDLSATIDWGDGHTSAGTLVPVAGQPGQYTVVGTHTYAEEGVFSVKVSAIDAGGSTADDNASPATATVADAALSVTKTDFSATEGVGLVNQQVATFTDAGGFESAGSYTATIDWGDSTSSAGVITISGGVGHISGNHTYAEEGNYSVKVVVNDEGGSTANDNGAPATASVADAALSLTLNAPTPGEGIPLTGVIVGTFTDAAGASADINDFTATIHWGDGAVTTATAALGTIVSNGLGGYNIIGTHTYADEFTNITFKVDIADAGGASDTKNTLISVADTPPTADLSTSANASNEGAVYTLHVGATTDPGPNHITGYAINWGDGNVDTFASGGDPANANFTHTYTDGPAARHISMTLIDEDGPHANSGTHDVTVNNVNPTATLQNLFPSISEGDAGSLNFTAQHDDSSVDTASGFHYAYDFNNDGIFDSGDGSYGGSGTSSSINVPASYLIIPGQHSVKARIIDKDGGFTDYTTTITSANVSPTVNLPANLTAGAGLPFTFTGSFSDPGTSDGPWTGVVDYGDGSGFVALSVNSANHTFQLSHTWATSGPYTLVVHISDHPVSPDGIQPPAASLTGAASSAVNVTATTFQVINFTPTASGFDVQFNRGADLSKLNLYGSSFGGFGASDVSFVGNNTGVVAGSLIWDPSTDTAHFVATGGRLAADTYNVTLFSRADGWTDTSNNALDGDGNNTNGGDFARQFVLSYPLPPRTVSMPDFARGPGQTVDLPNTSSGAGIPITISDAANVLSVDFDLVYNTSLLNITGATLASGLPADWGLTINFISPGRIKFTASGTTPLSAGAKQIIKLTATVPQTAAYAGAADLQIQNLSVNEGNIASVGDSAVEKVAYFGDASGNAVYTGLDAGLISRVVVHLDSGFDAYPLVDPVIVGDVTGDGSLSGLDASFVAQKASNLPRPEIPNIPTGFSIVGGGIDPTFTGSSHTLGLRGGQADFTVLLDQITGITDIGFTITASYTAGVLHLANGDISLGEALPAGWSVVANTDDINGNTVLTFFNGGTNMTSDATKPIVHLGFHVPGNDNPGLTPVQLSGPSVDGTPGHQVSYSYVDGSIDIAPFFTGTAGDDQYTVRLNGTGDTVQVWENQPTSGAPTYSFAASLLSLANFNLFKFTTLGGNDTLTIDYSNGNPLPAGGVIFDGGTNTAGGDTLVLKLGDGGNAVTVDGSGVKVGSTPLNLTSDEHVVINGGSGDDSVTQTAVPAAPFAFNGGAGNDSLSIMAGSYTFTTDASATTASLTVNVDGAGSSVTFSSTEHLAGLHLTGSGTAKITSTATPFTPSVLNVHSLSIASGSTLDITNNEAIIDSSLASIQPDLQAGRIFSSTPVAGEGLGSHALTPTQSVVRLSLLGDTNLDGSVDVGDLGQLASNYGQTSGATWEDGDTNNDGAVDVADLGMLATNYGVSLSNGAAAPSSQAAVFASANVVTAPVATPAAAVAQPAALLSTTSTTISTAKSDVPAVTVTTKSTAKKADHSQVSGNHTRVEPSSTLPLKHKGQKKGDILGDDLKSL